MKFLSSLLLMWLATWADTINGEAHSDGDDHMMMMNGDHGYVIPDEFIVERVEYTDSTGAPLVGFLSVPEDDMTMTKKPALIFIHDASGPNDYEKTRATMVAQNFGWVGFAADIFGAEYEETGPGDDRGMLLRKYRNEEPWLYMDRIKAAVDLVAAHESVDPTKIALAGYCFGGSGVQMFAIDDGPLNDGVAAVVSFHGGLGPHVFEHQSNTAGNYTDLDTVKPKILVLSGGEDDTSTNIQTLETVLDNSGAEWEITRYWGIQHAWTEWNDSRGRYNEWADITSWYSMIEFLKEVFGETSFEYDPPMGMADDGIEAVDYTDMSDNKGLRGYLAKPDPEKFDPPYPAVVIVPDWDGTNTYEKERAKLLAESGYVAFAADIYGKDLQENLDIETRIEQVTLYRGTNKELYFSRMQTALDLLATYEFVDADNMAMIGYCFGGSGVVIYAMMGGDSTKVVGAFHGGFPEELLLEIAPSDDTVITPYTMILSGGNDGQHGNQTLMESLLNAGNATWEISRWSGVDHGFTAWTADAYNLRADYRSWSAFFTGIADNMKLPKAHGHDEMMDEDDGDDEGDDEADGEDEDDGDATSDDSGVSTILSAMFVVVGSVITVLVAL